MAPVLSLAFCLTGSLPIVGWNTNCDPGESECHAQWWYLLDGVTPLARECGPGGPMGTCGSFGDLTGIQVDAYFLCPLSLGGGLCDEDEFINETTVTNTGPTSGNCS